LFRLQFVLIVSTLFSASLFAQQQLDCVTTHYPPYTVFTEDEPPTGRDIGLLRALSKAMDWDIEFIDIPWGRLKRSIHTEPFQCYFSLANIEDRSEYLQFSKIPLHTTQYALFYRSGISEGQLRNWTSLRIGGMRGIRISEKFIAEYNIEPKDFIYLDSNESLVDMLLLGRIDGFVTNNVVGNMLTRHEQGIDSFVISSLDVPVFLAIHKSMQVDMDKVDTVLNDLIQAHQKVMASNERAR